MEPTITSTNTLSIVAEFADGDTRTITLNNPKQTGLTPLLETVETLCANVLIGDKNGAAFTNLGKVTDKKQTKTTVEF